MTHELWVQQQLKDSEDRNQRAAAAARRVVSHRGPPDGKTPVRLDAETLSGMAGFEVTAEQVARYNAQIAQRTADDARRQSGAPRIEGELEDVPMADRIRNAAFIGEESDEEIERLIREWDEANPEGQ